MKKIYFAIFLVPYCISVFFPAQIANAAITFDTSTSTVKKGFLAGPTTASSSFTVGNTNPNAVLVMCADVFQDTGGVGAVSSATFNLSPMIKFATSTQSTNIASECWYQIAPATGAHTASTTITGATDDITVWWGVFDGVNQTTPITATGTWTGVSTTSSVSITPFASTDYIVDTISRFGTNALTATAGQTKFVSSTGNSAAGGASYEAATSTSAVNMSWSWTTANDSEQIAFNLKAAVSTKAVVTANVSISGGSCLIGGGSVSIQ